MAHSSNKVALFATNLDEMYKNLDTLNMDDLDRQLIGRLRKDGRASVADLATSLQVSRGTITNRMARLERDGVIMGYTAVIADSAATIRAWMSIRKIGRAHV